VARQGPPHVYFPFMIAVTTFLLFISLANSSQAVPREIPSSFERTAKQADQARTSNRLNDAIAFYRQAIRLRPSWSEGWWWLGTLLYDQDRFPEAQTAFKHFVAIAPKPEPAFAFLALCEYETHDYAHSLQHFQEWARRGSPGTDALLDVAGYHWALLLTRQGKFTQALYLLTAKAKKLGAAPVLTEAMGLASLRMANLPEDYASDKRELVWLAGRAALYSSLDDPKRAAEYAGRLLLRYGDKPNVHYFRGTLYGFEKEQDAAAEEYRRELQGSPQHVPAMLELALVQIEDAQASEAVPLAKRAVTLDPENPRVHYVLGRALFDTGRFQESVHELEIAKQIAPEYGPIRFTLANAYRRLGRIQEAERETAAFLSLKKKEGGSATPDEKDDKQKQTGQPQ
jgi:tetratricopeptide (TPR) repeat protein